ncbi:AraC family transcriptional regulator [Ruegeria sp. 2205SS24-7]|uniref:AraC family transcriptional regulator n=1 Tax=Ruegeria discodermiae TaxID=3064389 RepID=UPI002741BD4D|nr:AraC family transcriptional regulator [Ruegeria sp. 2205SS24-7]MDP5218062.1 AraC family transcriptional regulator [Ruegeria sp. 2205SS24-7]
MSKAYEDRILRVLGYIHDNPAGDQSLDALADVAAMSRFHWHRVFRAMTGETCAQAVRRIRLHRAAGWLLQSDRTPEQIAGDVGYPNPKSFARAFSEAYGASPSAFRKAGRLTPAHPQFRTGDYPMYPITTRTEPARRMIGIAHKGAYMEIGKSFESFGAICEARQLWPDVGPVLALYLDSPDEVPEADLRSFAGGEFRGADVPEGMEERHIPGGKTAVLTYKGPYSGLHAAYHSLFGNWLPESGEEPDDQPCYEIYLNDPRETAPEDLLTEICLPLK